VIFGKLLPVDGTGGIIAVDKDGNYTMTFNTSGMFRGVVTADGKREVAIYKIFSESPLISQEISLLCFPHRSIVGINKSRTATTGR